MKIWSVSFRIWHWLFALTFLFLSMTVLIRETVMDKEQASIVIMDNLSLSDVNISKEDAVDMAKELRRPLWKWHILVGYGFAFLVLARYILFATRSGKQNYQNCDKLSTHKKMVSGIYLLVYVLATVLALSGLSIKFNGELDLSEEMIHTVKEIHEISFYVMLALILSHIAGVIIAENRDEKGIISNMVGKSE